MSPKMKKMLSTDKEQLTDEESPLLSSFSSRLSDHHADNKGAATKHNQGRLIALTVAIVAVVGLIATTQYALFEKKHHRKPRIAFIGNSMIYYQDLPRYLETLAQGQMEQNSCLHGGTTLSKILVNGNGMFDKFNTSNALVQEQDFYGATIYDYGACTVPQLLFGRDEALQLQVYWKDGYLVDDGMNPCLQQGRYYDYLLLQQQQQQQKPPKWDFIVFNDNTRNPGRNHTRWEGLHVLEHVYLPWIRELKSIPVFLDTHAYWSEEEGVDLTGLASSVEEMPLFTSYTYEGYRQYAQLLRDNLPSTQNPRIAPVGIAFLMVWEENRDLWHRMFHNSDHLHASPTGTFLTGCVMYHTLFQEMPSRDVCLVAHNDTNEDMSSLFARARVMQDAHDPPNPFPTREDAEYLYDICERVAVRGEKPASFITFSNGEAAPDEARP